MPPNDVTTIDGLVGDPNAVPVETTVEENAASYAGDNLVGGTTPQDVQGIPTDSTAPAVQDTTPDGTEATYPSSVADYSPTTGGVDPSTVTPEDALAGAGTLTGKVDGLSDDTGILGDAPGLQANLQADTSVVTQIGQVNPVSQGATNVYTSKTTTPTVNAMLTGAQAATGDVDPNAISNIDTFDMKGLATGVNSDGTQNAVGASLNTVYTQNISTVVDTSTISGKLLANTLGEGNYTDAKTTVQGQMAVLSEQFIGPNGEPRIPAFAAGAVKGVERMLAFKGVTGTAAMGAVASATMESILPIAQADSAFFQTLTVKNLDAKNTQALNTANILSKMNIADLDTRMTESVQNAKTFMAYDMNNLNNTQQMTIVKTQARQQSIMEDAKQENVRRRFSAESQNQMDMYYDNLGSQISQFNVGQRNALQQFNVGQTNDMSKFNTTLSNQREQYEVTMQRETEIFNEKWRQTIATTNTSMQFEAAALDVKNIANLTTEQLNNMWDRTDALLDFAWKEGENSKDRGLTVWTKKLAFELERYQTEIDAITKKYGYDLDYDKSVYGVDKDYEVRMEQIRKEYKAAKINAVGSVIGAVVGAIPWSDEKLKTNIKKIRKLKNGVTLYKWDWTETAKKLGIEHNPTRGVLAQEVIKTHPHAVKLNSNGYLSVDYGRVLA